MLRRLNPLRRLRSAIPRGASAIGIDSCAEVKALLSQRLVMCDAQRMGGAVCRPLTAVAVAIERNRSVNDPASRPRESSPRRPGVVHATVPGDQFLHVDCGEKQSRSCADATCFARARPVVFHGENQCLNALFKPTPPPRSRRDSTRLTSDFCRLTVAVRATRYGVAPQVPNRRKRAGCVKAATAPGPRGADFAPWRGSSERQRAKPWTRPRGSA